MSKYDLRQLSEFEFLFDVEELEETQYKVSFSSSAHFLPTDLIEFDLYEVAFNRIGKKKGQTSEVSERIMETISFAITRFIEKYNCPIFFMCDSLDNKEAFRMKRFSVWYSRFEENNQYTFEVRELYSDEQDFTYFTGLIIHNNHPKIKEFITEIDNPKILKSKD